MQPIKADYTPIVETHYRLSEFQREAEQRRRVREATDRQPHHRHALRWLMLLMVNVRRYWSQRTGGQVEMKGKEISYPI